MKSKTACVIELESQTGCMGCIISTMRLLPMSMKKSEESEEKRKRDDPDAILPDGVYYLFNNRFERPLLVSCSCRLHYL